MFIYETILVNTVQEFSSFLYQVGSITLNILNFIFTTLDFLWSYRVLTMTLHNSFWQTFYWDSKIEQFMITQTYRHNIYSSSRHSVKGHFYYRMKSNFIPTWLSNFFYYTQCSNTPKNNHLSSSTQSTGALQNTLTEIAKFI